ncbi:dihydrolipoyl dehydrogenase [Pseudobacteriovorax antillogorgiicola]|uniref:Dihydrolipoyl dehydrogenase n=1 Tax=Pseudobacteriovorax antillogorgiicola TaxID=1513793 RepID=A0A1Y6B675_9BACT|nr:dihydrolipoyl dehydrogenase [Pseudobacteriovorax antillogorgiicola]TCS58823.1 dihydrolipoamide dehydrogenase [Pseudobacteriovorax antillogorgiicola]SME94252.1 dihydrolipoamide dehydrogenase [Pseudobacteriovorax antillogorgiicola]
MSKVYDLVVIGAGPGGEVGAIRAAQLGLSVALIEKRAHLGGTCLNVGCIPTKALLASAKTWTKLQQAPELGFTTGDISYNWAKIMERKDKIVDQQRKGLRFLMKKNKIDVIEGHARLSGKTSIAVTGNDGKVTNVNTKNILLATGSRVKELPFAKSNGKNIMTSDTILSIDHVPKSMAVVGGGVVGTEFASLFARMGSDVTIIELFPQILPTEDGEVVKEMVRNLKKQKIKIDTATKLSKLDDKGKKVKVSCEGKDDREFDKVLLSIGREPVTDDLGLDKVGLKAEKGGFIKVDEHYKTAVPNIYAIGDIIATPALAHTASAEAHHAVEVIAGHKPQVINYEANPNAIYTYPEVASIGHTEEACKEKGLDYKVAKFPFAPMAKAKIEDAGVGFVKIIFEPKYREILGVHIIGATATEMIAEFALGKILETTVDEIGMTIHPHPTISETIMEAAHAATGGAIHM